MAKIGESILVQGAGIIKSGLLQTSDYLKGAELLDAVGYKSIEVSNFCDFSGCLTSLAENPWERLGKLGDKVKNTPLLLTVDGLCLFSSKPQPDEIIKLFVQSAIEAGIDIFRLYSPLNDTRNLEIATKAALEAGKEVEGVVFLMDATDTIKIGTALKELGCTSICLTDSIGSARPELIAKTVKQLKEETGLPITVLISNSAGLATLSYYAAIRTGADNIECTLSPFSSAFSLPPTEAVSSVLSGTSQDSGLDVNALNKAEEFFSKITANECKDSLKAVEARSINLGLPAYSIAKLAKQIQEKELNSKFNSAMEELSIIRKDLGNAALVSPLLDPAIEQAIKNASNGKRYASLDSDVQNIVSGLWGAIPGTLADDLKNLDIEYNTDRAGSKIDFNLDEMKSKNEKAKDNDLVSLSMFPKQAEALFNGKTKPTENKDDKPKTKAYSVHVDGEEYYVEIEPTKAGAAIKKVKKPKAKPAPSLSRPAPQGSAVATPPPATPRPAAPTPTMAAPAPAAAPAAAPQAAPQAPAATPAESSDGNAASTVSAPMQGTLIKIIANVGDTVNKGDKIAVLEAMKMENDILATSSGTIQKWMVSQGDNIQVGQNIAEIG